MVGISEHLSPYNINKVFPVDNYPQIRLSKRFFVRKIGIFVLYY